MKKLYLLPLLLLLATAPLAKAQDADSPQVARQKTNTYIEKNKSGKAEKKTEEKAGQKTESESAKTENDVKVKTRKAEKAEKELVVTTPVSAPAQAEASKEKVVRQPGPINHKSKKTPQPQTGPASAGSGENWFVSNGVFNHLDAAFTAGTTGIGFELATPVTKWVRLRAGYEFMPRFTINSHFDVTSYGGTATDGKPNASANFQKASDLLRQLTGYDVDRKVTMNNRVTYQSWKVLFDVFPFQNNRHWRVTAGLLGGSRTVGSTINSRNEYTTLVAIGIYNNMYDNVTSPDFMDHVYDEPIFGTVYLDPEVAQELQKKMLSYGRMGIHVGDFKDGTPYMMEPDEHGSVSALALINRVRPYLGIGYEGYMDSAKRWSAGFDLGVIFWGGSPKVYTHDGTCLNDLVNVRGDVKTYLDLMKGFPVYPTLNFRLSYTIF